MTSSTSSAEHNSPEQYCLDKALPDGSNLYYAALFTRESNKPTVIGLHALLQELYDVLLECSDPGIARIKFRWWQEELERLGAEEARHPVSRYLQANVSISDTALALLLESVTGFEQLLMHQQPVSVNDSLALFEHAASPIWRVCALLNGVSDNHVLANVSASAAAYYCIQSLQYPKTFMTEANCIVPTEIADWATLSQSMANADNPESFTLLMSALMEQLDHAYQSAETDEKRRCKQHLLLNRLAHATGQEIMKSGCQLLTMRVSLTPIRKLIIAGWHNLLLR